MEKKIKKVEKLPEVPVDYKPKRGRPKKAENYPSLFKQKNKQFFLNALDENYGIIAPALKAAGITRQTFHNYYNKDEKFRLAVDEIRNNAIENVESELVRQIKDKNTTATIFYLKCRGGWVDTQNLKIDATSEVKIKYIIPEEPKDDKIQIDTPITITISDKNNEV